MTLNKDTAEVLVFFARVASGIGFVVEDGRLTLGDITHFKRAAGSALIAYDGIQNVNANDLRDPEARSEALEIFSAEFDIPQEEAEFFIEEGAELGLRVYNYGIRLVAKIREYGDKKD